MSSYSFSEEEGVKQHVRGWKGVGREKEAGVSLTRFQHFKFSKIKRCEDWALNSLNLIMITTVTRASVLWGFKCS